MVTNQSQGRWILLIHQIPPNPAYLRVKVGRRLARVGAVALKNSVYILPHSDSSFEDFQWLRREIVESGGEATVVEAQFVEGLSDLDVESLFRNARDADYAAIAEEARALGRQAKGKISKAKRLELESEIVRIERRASEVAAIDFFGVSGAVTVAGLIDSLRQRLAPVEVQVETPTEIPRESYVGRTWVTRTGIHVDRIASAWLIRKHIDSEAQFKFVRAKGYQPLPGELRFDMFEAEFAHQGDHCTFEVLCERFDIREPGLQAVGEIIHDIDLKDNKYHRSETDGVAALIAGICLLNREDLARLERGTQLFEELQTYYARKKDS
jgi:hypothetical protein